ncbi:Crp/Fnr family transcriptional regulator [Mycobacterium parmense]|uniref:Crp/Fnr family transcriptional regulator n=1 Tax=Mycobacterium parmense TaxID=185642 RepID=A0A7I7Z1G5_9MYCO|nr:Crp/Fnr family transcriptional regulator [Mycobacterium parmense]MCV7352812.1 Crp/Fnr family transcriptional regulator [Mycobacterium parmense]ORW52782.1 Crp/Fnr family transcriptional regulator [Mycobacterium parmense]BBZ46821.1 Crp/Fnr family transcriptional regulator [Mycobacterium parmense]
MIGERNHVEFAAGEEIFAEGDPGDRVFVIDQGMVKITLRGAGGRTSMRAILGPAEIFGELAVLDQGPRSCSATAITDVRARWLDRATLRTRLTEQPALAEQLLQVLARRLRDTDEERVGLLFGDVTGRVAGRLLELGRRFGTPEGPDCQALRVSHHLSQDELAQLVGADRASINKALREFAAHGWIRVDGRSVVLLDAGELTRRSSAGSSEQLSRRRRPLRATA